MLSRECGDAAVSTETEVAHAGNWNDSVAFAAACPRAARRERGAGTDGAAARGEASLVGWELRA